MRLVSSWSASKGDWLMYDAFDVFDDFTMTVEEGEASIARHVKTCAKAQRDEYCKVCLEY